MDYFYLAKQCENLLIFVSQPMPSLLNCIGVLTLPLLLKYITSIAKTASKKIGALICSMTFLSAEVALYLKNLPYVHVWNTVVTSGLVPLVATWNCWTSYKNGYAGLLVLHLLLLLNPWLIVEMWPA